MPREVKVGLTVLAALLVLAAGIFLIGDRSTLFRAKNHYTIRFETAGGLVSGNPVQLSGVNVGTVEAIRLPTHVGAEQLIVEISLDRRFAERIRQDSEAHIKTLGLLGDKFVAITPGTGEAPTIPDGGQIPAAPQTDVDRLLASGEDVMENVVGISHSLEQILMRMERGEGLLGDFTTDSEASREMRQSLHETLGAASQITERVQSGEGTLGRLIYDAELANSLARATDRLASVAEALDEGEGILPSLLHDAEAKANLDGLLRRLETTVASLEEFAAALADDDGLLPRLVNDPEYGDEVSRQLQELVRSLNRVAGRLEAGDGTIGQLINDPQAYRALNDILVGVNESKILRWLIRNRQKKGIQKRYEAAVEAGEAPPERELTESQEPPR